MHTCLICHKNHKNQQSLSGHIRTIHKLTKKEYYDTYLKKENEGLCKLCGNETTFRGSHYLTYCSNDCYTHAPETIERIKVRSTGKKQSKECIEQRIKNTNQEEKEKARSETMLLKYGSISMSVILTEEQKKQRSQKLSKTHSGRKHTKEHHEKVTETKRKNGTLKHSQATKDKLSRIIKSLYQTDDPPVTISKNNNGRGHKTGYVNGIYFRSSYEEAFLLICHKFNIEVVSAENKEFRIQYFKDSDQHFYYPDFYLPKYDCVVEIKPISLLDYKDTYIKIEAGLKYNRAQTYLILTEEELFDETFEWVKNLEYILYE